MKKVISFLAVFSMLISAYPVLAVSAVTITGVTVTKPVLGDGTYIESARDVLITTDGAVDDASVLVFDSNSLVLRGDYNPAFITAAQRSFAVSISGLKPSTTYSIQAQVHPAGTTDVVVSTSTLITSAFGFDVTLVNVETPSINGSPIPNSRDIIATFSQPAKDVSLDVYEKLTLGLVGNYLYKFTPAATQTSFALSIGGLKSSTQYKYIVSGHSQADNSLATKEGFFTTSAFTVTTPAAPEPLSGLSFDSLIKSDGPAVYYYANDGKRYVFPDSKTFVSWYSGSFYNIVKITSGQLASIPFGGLVTMHPGSMVKIESDPRVYVVDKGGILRLIETESMAYDIGGVDWAKKVSDIPVSFFTNYKQGSSIISKSQYTDIQVFGSLININQDKGLD